MTAAGRTIAGGPAPSLAPPAWLERELRGATGRGVRIGVVDSGVDPGWRAPGLCPGVGLVVPGSGTPSPGYVLLESSDAADRIGHGTACAGILHEMAPGAELYPIRVFHDHIVTSVEILAAAIRWAVAHGMHLVNLSLGTVDERAVKPLYLACEEARARGIAVVSAVHAVRGASYPAIFDNSIGVQAGRFGNVFDYEFRPGAAVECVAQGARRVRALGGGWEEVEATSVAAPHVTAIAALLLERHPGAGLDDLRGLLARCSLTGRARRARPAPIPREVTP